MPDARTAHEMKPEDTPEAADEKPAEPAPVLGYRSPDPAPVVPYYSGVPSEHTYVTLRTMDAMEAQLARAKLESEGIRCYVDGQLLSAAHPFLFSSVKLQVVEAEPQQQLGRLGGVSL